jgi:deoxyinosine 3'endonuclease (endonuclease V)
LPIDPPSASRTAVPCASGGCDSATLCETLTAAWRCGIRHSHGVGTGRHLIHGLCVAVDVHDLRTGGAQAAAVVAADAIFSQVLVERTAVVPEVLPYRPGEFYLRELPPLRAVLQGIGGLGLLLVDGYADLDPGGRPGLGAHARAEFAVQ